MSLKPTQRAEPRRDVDLVATIETFGGRRSKKHCVRNLSNYGACLSEANRLRAGQTIIMAIGNLDPIAATVRWANNGRAGLRFVQPVDVGAAIGRD